MYLTGCWKIQNVPPMMDRCMNFKLHKYKFNFKIYHYPKMVTIQTGVNTNLNSNFDGLGKNKSMHMHEGSFLIILVYRDGKYMYI